MDGIQELERKYEELGKEIEKLKSGDKLRLELFAGDKLRISYRDGVLGWITKSGYCYILSCDVKVKVYEQWRADGMPVDESVIKWRGGEYQLYKSVSTGSVNLARHDIEVGNIYDFSDCVTFRNCYDDNIKRFKHNNRPIIY
jgi:hypothetical protein